MKNNLSKSIEDLVKAIDLDNAQIKEFMKADEEYKKLLQEGMTEKRGFNLLTTQEIYDPALNCSHKQFSH